MIVELLFQCNLIKIKKYKANNSDWNSKYDEEYLKKRNIYVLSYIFKKVDKKLWGKLLNKK